MIGSRASIFVVLFIVFSGINGLMAQIPGEFIDIPAERDTVMYAWAPALLYTSDLGLIGGGLMNRYQFKPGYEPFYSLFEIRLLLSTKGLISTRMAFEHTETLGKPIRSRWDFFGERLLQDNFFGLGNDTQFDPDSAKDGYYFYESRGSGLSYRARIPIREYGDARLEFLVLGSVSYFTPWVSDKDSSLIVFQPPPGFDGGFVVYPGIGFHWENRDNEFSATRGNSMRLETAFSQTWLGSDFSYGSVFLRGTQFYTLSALASTTFAMMLGGEWVAGDTPFWKLAYLGGEERVRGFPLYRFRADGAIWYSLEARNWIYHDPYLDFKFGLHAFTDGGRVFSKHERLTFNDFHATFGGGMAFQLFAPEFILRIEYAVSPEMGRLYMGVGYLF